VQLLAHPVPQDLIVLIRRVFRRSVQQDLTVLPTRVFRSCVHLETFQTMVHPPVCSARLAQRLMRRGQRYVSRVLQVFFLMSGQPSATHALQGMPALQARVKSSARLVGTHHQGQWFASGAIQGLGPTPRVVRAPRAQRGQLLQPMPQIARNVLLDMRAPLRMSVRINLYLDNMWMRMSPIRSTCPNLRLIKILGIYNLCNQYSA
jgi:hypothetical protein